MIFTYTFERKKWFKKSRLEKTTGAIDELHIQTP